MIQVAVQSNGTVLNDDAAERLWKEAEVASLKALPWISLDGLRKKVNQYSRSTRRELKLGSPEYEAITRP